jgi:hypothetical protein
MDKIIKMPAIAGGEPLTVAKVDGSGEAVTVRILHIKDFPALLRNMGNEIAQVEIYCGKDPGWGETLTNGSIVAAWELGEKLNSDFFVSWAQRRMKQQERFIPGITASVASAAIHASSALTNGSQNTLSVQE